MSKVIVTGAAGFIGSSLAETLLQQGITVVGVDQVNDYYDTTLKRKNLAALAQYQNFQLIEADIQHLDWEDLLQGVSVVYHQAAQAGVRASWGIGFRDYTERNINSTQVMLEAAKKVGTLERFVYAGTSSVYGDAETMPTPETICPQPVSPYGITKLAAERLCWLYLKNYAVPVTSLRYFTVYGPRQRPDMAFHKFFRAAILGESIGIYGDGKQTRDFTYISDAVQANLLAAQEPKAIGEIFNIGGGSRVILNDVLDEIDQIVGQPIPRNYGDRARGDARHTSADVTKAKTILGYDPQVKLSEGLRREWDWIQSLY
ncbi:NAD-dependent epimerase/dehydratase family protein [Picosynechococcus sp. PCC 8807]|uniref:NAD-dependent epimerase/dehydratase family protein n=1 Tax=Picosynechococcus sp. PCC 8807 TaxID=195248 RepID=UPI000810D251|nr:NAD-dependent epimerase/dehydratase family protein [Picosynechococcus sp. PCC 8807]ANV90825.1 UDP-glucose 4-epimerase [Picosynechococcus sp. PCC 8807]